MSDQARGVGAHHRVTEQERQRERPPVARQRIGGLPGLLALAAEVDRHHHEPAAHPLHDRGEVRRLDAVLPVEGPLQHLAELLRLHDFLAARVVICP